MVCLVKEPKEAKSWNRIKKAFPSRLAYLYSRILQVEALLHFLTTMELFAGEGVSLKAQLWFQISSMSCCHTTARARPPTCCLTLGKLLLFSTTQSSRLSNEGNVEFTVCLRGTDEIHVEAYMRDSTNVE